MPVCSGAARIYAHCPSHLLGQIAVSAAITFFALAVLIGQRVIERKASMSKLERAIIAFGVSAAALAGALGFVNNGRDQVLVATIPTVIANAWAIGSIIWSSIEQHTKALIAAIDRRTQVLAGSSRVSSGVRLAGPDADGNGVVTGGFSMTMAGAPEAPKRYKTGRLKAVWPVSVKSFAEYLTRPLGTPPLTWPVPVAKYPIDGNDVYGCCTIAGIAHAIAALNKWLKKRDHVPDTAQVETEYFAETGGQDTGLVEANVLAKWMTKGLFGHKIRAYAPIKVQGVPIADAILALKQCVAFYGVCYLGILCPNSAQDQFAEQERTGQQVPWTNEGEQTDEGHCIVALGYTEDGLLCATWGAPGTLPPVLVTWEFLFGAMDKPAYLEEAWVILSHELVDAKKDTLGIDLPTLTADLAAA